MEAPAATHDAAVQMIDTSIVRVHQPPACITGTKDSPGPITRRIDQQVSRVSVPCSKSARTVLQQDQHCRRVATRYDKLAANYLALVQLASIWLWLRVNESTT